MVWFNLNHKRNDKYWMVGYTHFILSIRAWSMHTSYLLLFFLYSELKKKLNLSVFSVEFPKYHLIFGEQPSRHFHNIYFIPSITPRKTHLSIVWVCTKRHGWLIRISFLTVGYIAITRSYGWRILDDCGKVNRVQKFELYQELSGR